MKDTQHKKSCLVIGTSLSVIGVIGLTTAAALIGCGLWYFIQVLDEMTKPIDDYPTGVGFFDSTGGWDYRRMALIEPYDAMNTNNDGPWLIGLETITPGSSAEATKLNVIDKKYIIAYAPDSVLNYERVEEVWFVIIPAENFEQGFATEAEFLAYLSYRGVEQPEIRDVEELFQELLKNGYLDWFPEEYKSD